MVIIIMKIIKALGFLALFVVAASAYPTEEGREHGVNGWYVPQENGTFVWLNLNEAKLKLTQLEKNQKGRISLNPVSFYLYTSSNPQQAQKIETTKKSIEKSNLNPKNPTRFVIHGFLQSSSSGMNKHIRDAWLSRGDFNIIIVDWARARSIDYISSVIAVPTTGKKVAAMIDFLAENYQMSLDTLHVIGHSLGAHIAGYTGKNVENGQIHCIVGLDPALPLFSYDNPNTRLSSTDAWYVETIHTNAGSLGFLQPIGKGAFYPNGGRIQPGCGWEPTGACDHERSTAYYAEAIQKDDFPTVKCSSYEQAVNRKCGSTYSPVRMGAESNAFMGPGEYFVPVNSKTPFGMAE